MTIEEIKSLAQENSVGRKQTIIEGDGFFISIVGGMRGLYGDFVNDFEVAIIDSDSKNFITRHVVEGANDDILPYQTSEQVVELVNKLIF